MLACLCAVVCMRVLGRARRFCLRGDRSRTPACVLWSNLPLWYSSIGGGVTGVVGYGMYEHTEVKQNNKKDGGVGL